MNKNIPIAYEKSLNPFYFTSFFIDKGLRMEKLLNKHGIKYKVKNRYRYNKLNAVYLIFVKVRKKDIEKYKKCIERFFDDIILTENFDTSIAMQEIYEKIMM